MAPGKGSLRALPFFSKIAGSRVIDDIDVKRDQKFWTAWKLVSVRYRKDNGEQRFIYANDIAWNAMQRGDTSYPDEAVFAKIAFTVHDDPAFPNSLEPANYTRIQFMKKNSGRYQNTNGWGYALLLPGGESSSPGSDRKTAIACHACHGMVPERDFVFSRPAFLERSVKRGLSGVEFKSRFITHRPSELTMFRRQTLHYVLRNEPDSVLGEIRGAAMDMFAGSLNESIGVLSRFATDDKQVYALWDDRAHQFVIARPLKSTAACATNVWVALSTGINERLGPNLIATAIPGQARTVIICNGVLTSNGSM